MGSLNIRFPCHLCLPCYVRDTGTKKYISLFSYRAPAEPIRSNKNKQPVLFKNHFIKVIVISNVCIKLNTNKVVVINVYDYFVLLLSQERNYLVLFIFKRYCKGPILKFCFIIYWPRARGFARLNYTYIYFSVTTTIYVF